MWETIENHDPARITQKLCSGVLAGMAAKLGVIHKGPIVCGHSPVVHSPVVHSLVGHSPVVQALSAALLVQKVALGSVPNNQRLLTPSAQVRRRSLPV